MRLEIDAGRIFHDKTLDGYLICDHYDCVIRVRRSLRPGKRSQVTGQLVAAWSLLTNNGLSPAYHEVEIYKGGRVENRERERPQTKAGKRIGQPIGEFPQSPAPGGRASAGV